MNPELVVVAKRLHRRNPKTGERKSLRSIAAELANLGHVNVNGRPFAAQSIQAMIRKTERRVMRKLVCLLALLTLVFCQGAGVRDFKGSWKATGEGSGSCGEWAKFQQNRPPFGAKWFSDRELTFADIKLAAQLSWVYGFLSASNYYGTSASADITNGIDQNGLFVWIDNYWHILSIRSRSPPLPLSPSFLSEGGSR
jgi:hypothetical protein